MTATDIAVVGGGIVGLATAHALQRSGARVTVIEAEPAIASHQTGHNSGVIHSGLYYRPGSLKAVTCTEGREAMYSFCEQEGVPTRRCGKLVVATRDSQLDALATLEQRGRANGLAGITRLSPDDVRRLDPEITAVAALWVAETGVVDYRVVSQALAKRITRGGEFAAFRCTGNR